ncbi:DUF309 domain-containing protein [Ruegeria pomeroyi]|uniref:DUF309 domain-containing protein n=2 Tax=Ruegeria pomeroyi TaxID=89184 RepID=Q5LM65_RUEPO|nr:DUF309 domain-containing protein [Ruegeria pomeroyi]HCE72325.1 DUF309 domain-containing protein [Ruegeria sp.]AAV96920.1 hypothetical protein SPO3699 [Ruegeria pomeroyi DSS-3]NVK97901.1 DUF309 domain-containing protein [Ruegeria pomeroyi]NVL02403.1 DUF309 domain-containing protein [Ruegeria pomeroyi]QWV10449.1 DUF309 domain-containing protein [Ruegeria pomeroyi]
MELPPLSDPYMPGLTARPPEDLFEALHQSVPNQLRPDSLAACPAWIAGWRLLELGYFWEAHEVWEPVWMALPPNDAARHAVRAAIQLANAALKLRMGRQGAAQRLCSLAREAAGRANGAAAPEGWHDLFRTHLEAVEGRFEVLQNNA